MSSISFQTWFAQFKHAAGNNGLIIDESDEEKSRIKFIYYESGRTPERAVQKEILEEVNR